MGSGGQGCWLFSGLRLEGVYRKGGARARSLRLLAEFRRDARSVKLRPGEHFLEDVTDTLKRFFRELDDPVTSARLLPRWREAAGTAKIPKDSSQETKGHPRTAPISPESLRLSLGIGQAPSPTADHPGTQLRARCGKGAETHPPWLSLMVLPLSLPRSSPNLPIISQSFPRRISAWRNTKK